MAAHSIRQNGRGAPTRGEAAMSAEYPARSTEPQDAVAVVGLGFRVPGAINSREDLWRTLNAGKDVLTPVPPERFDPERFFDQDTQHEGKTYSTTGAFLDDISGFDADYFGISPKEASRVDPQQRLLLECTVEAFDDAQLDSAALAGSDTAVIIGVSDRNYYELQVRRLRTINAYAMSGSASCNTANRISYVFDFHGPSFAVDSACSSTLTAVHHACEAIRTGRSTLAVAGGVNVMLNPADFIGFSKASMLSRTGRCHPFSAGADGYVRGEGVGVFVLKALRAAIADGDRIEAVIVASAVNDDGTTSGLSLPSATSQQELLESVYTRAGIDPERVAYVEAHGTGTPAGDPLECQALGRALGSRRAQPLLIGSVKSTLGHLEAASGVAGLLKAMLVLRHETIPATLHALPLNDEIDFTGLGLEPVTSPRPLPLAPDGVLGVNSFGFGGANVHVVLRAAPVAAPVDSGRGEADSTRGEGELPVMTSGATEAAANETARLLADHLESVPDDFYDIAYTSCLRRTRREHRAVVLASDAARAAAGLRALAAGDEPVAGSARGTAERDGSSVGFVFSGNGSQWPGMARDLLAADEAFLSEVALIDGELLPRLGWSVLEALRRPVGAPELERTEVAQPLLFAVQGGLVASLAAAGITPAGVTGHSVGDVAAAYCSGALSRAAACQVIAERSRAQSRTAGSGRMAAIGLGPAAAQEALIPFGERLVIAGINGPDAVTVSGATAAIAELGRALEAREVFFRELPLDYAFHSASMDPVREVLLDSLQDLPGRPSRIPMVSSTTGRVVDGPDLDAEYWWRNIREPVRFTDALDTLLDGGCTVLVEIGPHAALTPYLRTGTVRRPEQVTVLSTLLRDQAGPPLIRSAIAAVLATGATTDWTPFFPVRGRAVPLPAYPWQRERHWSGEPSWWEESAQQDAPARKHPLLGERLPTLDPAWHQQLEPGPLAWLTDHKVGSAVVLPAAAYVDVALTAGENALDAAAEVTDLSIDAGLTLPFDDPAMDIRLQTTVAPGGRCTIASRDGTSGPWRELVHCRVQRLTLPQPPPLDLAAIRARTTRRQTREEHYATCARAQLPYGPAFRPLTALAVGETEVLADFTAPVPPSGRHTADVSVLDGALQSGVPLLATEGDTVVPYLPSGFAAVRSWTDLPATGHVHVTGRRGDRTEHTWDLTVTDTDGNVALEAIGCRLRRFNAAEPAAPSLLAEVLRAAPLPGTSARPTPLPSPQETAAADIWPDGPGDQHLHDLTHFRTGVVDTAAHSIARALTDILGADRPLSVPAVLATGVHPKHSRWLTALCRLAEARGVLRATGQDTWRIATEPALERIVQETLTAHPSIGAALYPYAVTGLHYADILHGRIDPLEFLFSVDNLASRVYDFTPNLVYQYRLARNLLRASLKNWPPGRPLRVLEVGAGTGGLTAAVLPVLPPELTRFTCTDISPAFFPHCRERLAAHDFVDYLRLDLDQDPTEQGFTPGSFDIVLAANALHTARDMDRTMRYVSGLLADHGHLLAIESHNHDVATPVFGMLDSYWDYEDTARRPDGPMLSWEEWRTLLEASGFDTPVQLGDHADPDLRDYSLILAAASPHQDTKAPGPAHPAPERTDPQDTTRWLIAATGTAHGRNAALARELAETLPNSPGLPHGTQLIEDADDPGSWTKAMRSSPGPTSLVLIGGDEHDRTTEQDTDPQALTDEAIRQLGTLRTLAQVHQHHTDTDRTGLWLITRSTAHTPEHPPGEPVAAALWGAARSLANELPTTPVHRISLPLPEGSPDPVDALVAELSTPTEEEEVLLTPEGRFVPRVQNLPAPTRPSSHGTSQRFTLEVPACVPHYELRWKAVPPLVPPPGQVVIAVEAAALNYRDIMTVTGRVPAPPRAPDDPTSPLGMDCAGTVQAVADDVTTPSVGDRVAGIKVGCFGSHAVLRADRLIPVPDTLRSTEAVTLPGVFITVELALRHLAHLSRNETLLVHSGAGGVGMLAVQYAQRVGATVIATAGTPGKRDLLRLLGVRHVLDSHTLEFADQIREITGGEGVDVVLNSLAGEALARSVKLLKPHGRFIELGKRDFLADSPLLLAPFLNNLTFFGVDVAPLLTEYSPSGDALVRSLADAVRTGTAHPPPHQVFPASRIGEAFQSMERSRHIGKVVIDLTDTVPVHTAPDPAPLDPDADYLITGGLGGFGAATARHLAGRGARHLTLVSRRGPDAPEAEALLADLRHGGVSVTAHAADAGDYEAMDTIVTGITAAGRRLAGVVHAAMVLDDAPFTELTDERLTKVLAPKLTGALILDRLTSGLDLDFLALYSSVTALTGNTTQAAYSAANLAMESLARRRRREGAPVLAIQFGVISDAGFVHRDQTGGTLAARGMTGTTAREALQNLDRLLAQPPVYLPSPAIALTHMDWATAAGFVSTLTAPRTAGLLPPQDDTATPLLREQLTHADPEEAADLVENALRELLAATLRTTPDHIRTNRRLDQMGVDSLMATELSTAIRNTFACELPPVELTNAADLTAITHRVLTRLNLQQEPTPGPSSQT
ncbi:SDR family NAD(P)-dependent oxidoreductase [Streptomyces uncialis]|uniref:SDR family NAD(P)-dependent oxidoreductase n=1 Tax=Streptomyces uncialis TaxID=1048205 RepID=UPI002E36F7B1|nr:SDR family NAD(P)-dependent oxidoreductase [Streptomyces uncialis]